MKEIKLKNGCVIQFITYPGIALTLCEGSRIVSRTSDVENFYDPLAWARESLVSLLESTEQRLENERQELLARVQRSVATQQKIQEEIARYTALIANAELADEPAKDTEQ